MLSTRATLASYFVAAFFAPSRAAEPPPRTIRSYWPIPKPPSVGVCRSSPVGQGRVCGHARTVLLQGPALQDLATDCCKVCWGVTTVADVVTEAAWRPST